MRDQGLHPSRPSEPHPVTTGRPRGHRRVVGSAAVRATLAATSFATSFVNGPMATAAPTSTTSVVQAADGAPASDAGSRERAFAAAAAEFGVPQTVLEAVSYAQTRWDFYPGHSTTGGYGPMHLVEADLGTPAEGRGLGGALVVAGHETPAVDSLGRAAALLGVAKSSLRTDERANIRGGAALLAAEQRRLGHPTGDHTDPGV